MSRGEIAGVDWIWHTAESSRLMQEREVPCVTKRSPMTCRSISSHLNQHCN